MLSRITIRNLVIVKSLDLALEPGMTALTGETAVTVWPCGPEFHSTPPLIHAPRMAIMPGLITSFRWNICLPSVLSSTACSRPPSSGRQVILRYSFSRNRAL